MKKLLALLVLLMLSVSYANAQKGAYEYGAVNYQGEIHLGYGFGTGTVSEDRVSLHTIHGAKIGKYLFMGAGVGADLYYDFDDPEIIIPLYLNLKGYVPVTRYVSPFISFDVGAGFFTSDMDSTAGLIIYPSIGVKAKKFAVQVGYYMQRIPIPALDTSVNMGSIQFRLGIVW